MNKPDSPLKKNQILWKLTFLTSIVGLAAVLVNLWRNKRAKNTDAHLVQSVLTKHPSLAGLSEAEADSKKLKGLNNAITYEPARSKKDIVRSNTLTIFNVSLVGVAFVQLLLGLHWDMLISLGVAVLNVSINVFQEIFAIRRLQALEPATRPNTTVIRDSRARSIDPTEIVIGDVLVVGPGDQIQVDGPILSEKSIVVDETKVVGQGNRLSKNKGDMLLAGSYCISGRAAYQAQKVGDERLIAELLKKPNPKLDERTPLEKIVERVLSIMLVIVVIMVVLILSHAAHLDTAVGLDTDVIVSRVSVVFSLAPAGLYFMIFMNYVGGVRQLTRQGALIRQARSVEILAQASTLWVSLTASRASIGIRVEDIMPAERNKLVSETRLHQILGDFAHTVSSSSQAITSLADLFPSDRRPVREQSPFLSVYGWMAVAFDEDDLRGVYVLGEKQVLKDRLATHSDSREAESGEKSPAAGSTTPLSFFRRFLRRSNDPSETREGLQTTSENQQPKRDDDSGENPESGQNEPFHPPKESRLRSFFNGIGRVFKRKPAPDQEKDQEKSGSDFKQPKDEVVYMFAYYPEIVPLHDSQGQPQLPTGLLPLCNMHYTAQVNPDAVNTIRTLRNSGVNLKGFTPGDSSRAIRILESAGINQEGQAASNTISGIELAGMDEEAIFQAANENIIFNHVTSDQTCDLVGSMRAHGCAVAVLGGNPADIPIMQKANLSITTQGSSQAALSIADIILLKEAPKAILTVMEKGQGIVRSLLDVLKLYLTQLVYLTSLILALWALDLGFPYLSQQGSIISIMTLTLPSLALSFWELPGALPQVSLTRQLIRFVGPASLSISAAGILVYTYFLGQSNQMAYAQLALTHMLVLSGLVLFILVRPPKRLGFSGVSALKEWRSVIVAFILVAAYHFFGSFQIAFKWFRLAHLQQPEDYVVIGAAVLGWAAAVQVFWWIQSVYLGSKDRVLNYRGEGDPS